VLSLVIFAAVMPHDPARARQRRSSMVCWRGAMLEGAIRTARPPARSISAISAGPIPASRAPSRSPTPCRCALISPRRASRARRSPEVALGDARLNGCRTPLDAPQATCYYACDCRRRLSRRMRPLRARLYGPPSIFAIGGGIASFRRGGRHSRRPFSGASGQPGAPRAMIPHRPQSDAARPDHVPAPSRGGRVARGGVVLRHPTAASHGSVRASHRGADSP
jgi:hypothetical protein